MSEYLLTWDYITYLRLHVGIFTYLRLHVGIFTYLRLHVIYLFNQEGILSSETNCSLRNIRNGTSTVPLAMPIALKLTNILQNKFSNKFRFQIQAEVFFGRNVFNFEKTFIVCNKQEIKSLLKRNLKWK